MVVVGGDLFYKVELTLVSTVTDRRDANISNNHTVDWIFGSIPYIVGVVGISGLALAIILKYVSPQRYADLGRTVLEDSHER